MPVYQVRSAHPPAAAGASASPAQAAVGHRGRAAPPPPARAVRLAGRLLVRVTRLRARARARPRGGGATPRARCASHVPGAILSILVGLWGLAFAATPIGAIGGAGAAVFGLAFGGLALLGHAWGRWSILALVVFAVFVLA